MKEKRKFKFHNYKASFDKRANHGNNHPSSKTSFKSEDHDNDNNEVNGDIEDKEGDDGGNEHEVSKASIPLEEVKAHPEYVNRVEFADKYSKHKYACGFSYCGSAYQGLQMNPYCKSVESELEKALFLGGLFQEPNYGKLQKLQWTRAARTDRGVHALGQCCSMRLHFPTDPLERDQAIARINNCLPTDIRLHTITKVTRAFNSHISCSSRRYKYLLPTYLFMPVQEINSILYTVYERQGPILDCAKIGGFAEPGSKKFLSYESLQTIYHQLSSYRCSTDQIEIFKKAIMFYQGTKSYHNFTTGRDSEDDSSKRFITECICSDPFIGHIDTNIATNVNTSNNSSSSSSSSVGINDISSGNTDTHGSTVNDGVEYVCVTICGQSFVLNQIRKMISLAVDVTRGSTVYDVMKTAVDPKIKMEIAMAPGLGLYLDELFFSGYNQKQVRDKERRIYDNIAANKKAEKKAKYGGGMTKEMIKASALLAVQKALQMSTQSQLELELELESDTQEGVTMQVEEQSVSQVHSSQDQQQVENNESVSEMQSKEQIDTHISKRGNNNDNTITTATESEVGGEPILWWSDPAIKTDIDQFQAHTLYPHVFAEEKSSLVYLYYLDYLRVRQYHNKVKE